MPRLFLARASKGKRVVWWTVAFIVAAQPVLWLLLEWRCPEVRDPAYTLRLRCLKARLAQSPGSPLVLLLGSSRTKYGLSPGVMKLPPRSGGPELVIYNFGINGLGSIRELLYLRRLLADGVRPDWLLLETWPPQWAEDGYFAESRMFFEMDELHGGDVALVGRYFAGEHTALAKQLRRNLVPIQTYRSRLLAAIPSLLPRRQLTEVTDHLADCEPADPGGWFPLDFGASTPEAMERALDLGQQQMKPLVDPLRIDPRSDAALRELLTVCRARGIQVALFMMPEHSAARGWYSPQAHALVQSYLGGLCRDFKVSVIDTRDWLPDSAFTDFCHIWCWAAPVYSERFEREVLQPLLDGKAVGRHVSLQEKAATQ
jgi:hypothetical protein